MAQHLGCRLDFSPAAKLRGAAIADLAGTAVICLTTAARWKNWPLANFRALLDRFPRTRFVLTGFRREVAEGEELELETMLRLPNVVNGLDRFSADELVRVVAHARAVITNDTSVAHIANLFEVGGAVLFGPVSPGTFASPAGLKVFHDASCPFHPCVQWKCSNLADWCMRKSRPRASAITWLRCRDSRAEPGKPTRRFGRSPARLGKGEKPGAAARRSAGSSGGRG